jgi:glutathione synthase/RimK-type ligase-like ATP-grasp enzyme
MQRILIIGRNFHPDGKETATQIYEGLTSLASDDVSYSVVYLKDIVFSMSNKKVSVWDAKSGTDLSEFDAVLMTNWFSHASVRKDMALALALYFEHNGVSVANSEALYSRSTSKLSQMMLAALQGVSIPATLFSLSFEALVDQVNEDSNFTYPVIFKDAQASRGNGNYLIQNQSDALKLKAEHTEKHPFIVQSFVDSDGSDYRFFVTNAKSRFVIHRIGTGESHLTNTSAGATTKVLPTEQFSQEIQDDVTKMSQLLRREVTGIDIMVDNSGGHYFLEANPIPQIATGSNVELKLSALEEGLIEAAKQRRTK